MKPSPFSSSGFFTGLGLPAFIERATGQLSDLMNGTWFSTQGSGECRAGERLGKECWWRQVERLRNVNASCVNDNMILKVIEKRPFCFRACPGDPDDHTTDCWISCLFETLVGNLSSTPIIKPMQKQEIVEAFEASFSSSDRDKGGCEEVPPCPEPCHPPCWAVTEGSPCQH